MKKETMLKLCLTWIICVAFYVFLFYPIQEPVIECIVKIPSYFDTTWSEIGMISLILSFSAILMETGDGWP